VVNNQAVASSRQGHDATPLFQRAVTADPNDADYHYNLAVSFLGRGDTAGAQREINLAVKLRPADPEALELKARLASGRVPVVAAVPAANSTSGNSVEFLTRIRRTYSEASFRQAAFQLDQLRKLRMATLPATERAKQYTQIGNDYLAQGLLPEAEQEFQAAIASDPASSSGHAGLAQIREQSGIPADARAEAEASLKRAPNVVAYLVLARLELRNQELGASAADVGRALGIDPKSSAAQGLRQALQARGQAVP
jgi:tetratricopeptide (TPR) repeat protein